MRLERTSVTATNRIMLSAVMGAALVAHRRGLMIFALYACAITWLMWAGIYAVSASLNSDASILTPLLSVFVATCCHAEVD